MELIPFQNKGQGGGLNVGSHNIVVNGDYININPPTPEPPKRGPSPLVVKALLILGVVLLFVVFGPHLPAALISALPELLRTLEHLL